MSDYPTNDLDSELIVGLVGAVGTEMGHVVTLLKERFGRAGYESHVIKVSREVISELEEIPDHGSDHHKRISDLMTAGNQVREHAKEQSLSSGLVSPDREAEAKKLGNAALAFGAAAKIFDLRTKDGEQDPRHLEKTIFVIDSLKRPEEVEYLRQTYPSGFVLIGVHAEEDRRRHHLRNNLGLSDDQVDDLFQRDGEESKEDYGQRLNKTFHLADFFVRATASLDRLRCDVQRIVEVLFGNPFLTPTFDEYSMFLAFAAALRSADLSRQVGAVITRDREILSTGANDCPKAGGGLYWPERLSTTDCVEDEPNGRDYMREEDSNRVEQLKIIRQIMKEIETKESLKPNAAEIEKVLEKSRIGDLTEFGRVVHAEMEAMLACARKGTSTARATLFCTTFPCHNCAKHIVAAGLERVVYVEPYPKSKALDFHDDSIITKSMSDESGKTRVKFEPFVGIGPRRFFDLFSMHLSSGYDLVRKDSNTGEKRDWSIENARLRLQMNPQSYLVLEAQARKIFGTITERTE